MHTCRRLLGIDRAVAYVLLNRGWMLVSGPLSVFLIGSCLTPAEQGYFYTFANILALRVFFELGLTYVILQFASHEGASLRLTPAGTLVGEPRAKARLASLSRFAFRWFSVLSLLALAVLLPAGLLFFGQGPSNGVSWRIPYMLLTVATAATLFISPLYSILQGCGLVAETNGYMAAREILSRCILWVVLLAGGHLYAAPLMGVAAVLSDVVYCFGIRRLLVRSLLTTDPISECIRWRSEIWPFQWRISISWLSGYFIYQLFNPVVFAYHGPVVAGKIGMSLAIVSVVSTTAGAWMNTKVPFWSSLVAQRQSEELHRSFRLTLMQSLLFCIGSVVLLWLVVTFIQLAGWHIGSRFVASLPLGVLAVVTILNHITNSLAVYLRTHRVEPFLALSVTMGALVAVSTLVLGRTWGAEGVICGYFAMVVCVQLPWSIAIYLRKKRQWYGDPRKRSIFIESRKVSPA